MTGNVGRRASVRTFLVVLAPLVLLAPLSASASIQLGEANTSALTSGLVGYWPLDGNTTNWTTGTTFDLSGQGNTGSLVSFSTTTSPTLGKIGQALKFNGSNTYVDVGSGSPLSLTGPLSVCAWVFPTGTPSNSYNIVQSSTQYFFALDAPSNALRFSDTHGHAAETSAFVTSGKWSHVCAVLSATSGTTLSSANTSLYINGITSPAVYNGAWSPTGGANVSIGRNPALPADATWFFKGTIDDVRIYNRALSATEVSLLYAAGKANVGASPKNALTSGLVGYWPLDGSNTTWTSAIAGTVKDLSGSGLTGTLNGMNRSTSPTIGKIGQALKFPGNNGNSIGNFASSISVAGSSRTVCAWFNTTSTARQGLVGTRGGTGGGFVLTVNRTAPGRLTYFLTGGTTLEVAAGITTGKWYHACAVHDATTNHASLYLNAILIAGPTAMTTESATTFNGVIGDEDSTLSTPFNGSIDDVRIYNRALSAAEVAQLYAQGAVNAGHSATGSSAPLSNGLVGYWTFDGPNLNWKTGTATDSSGQGNSGSLISMSTTTSPTIGKVGQALKFNGTSSYVNVSSVSSLRPTRATISFWLKDNATGAYQYVIDTDNDSVTVGTTFQIKPDRSGFYITFGNVGQDELTVYAVDSKWHHYTYTYDGASIVSYVDGVSKSSFVIAGSPSINWNSASPINIGRRANNTLLTNGTIDDVRIYNRALSAQEVLQLYKMGK